MSAAEAPARAPSGPVSPLAGVAMALVGVFAFSALMVLLAYAPDLRGGDDGGAQALSKSAIGFAGIAEALRLSGEPVVVNRAALPAGRRGGLLVVTPTPSTSRKAIEGLSFDGPVLVVLPKWLAGRDPRRRGWVRKVAILDPAMFEPSSIAAKAGLQRRAGVTSPVLRAGSAPFAAGQAFDAGPVDSLQSLTAPGWVPVLADETGGTILARDPHRPFYILSDPDLLNTQGVGRIRTLATGLAILRALRADDGPVIFDVRLNGLGRERSVLRLLLEPPFLGVTLCLAVAAALAGIQALFRFGPVRRGGRAIPLGKTALVDNTAALVRLAGREHRLGGRYADLTADLAARGVGAPRGLGGEALAAFLDRLSARRRLPKPFSVLESEARLTPSAARLVGAAEELHRWRVELTGEADDAATPPPAGSAA
ncbi:MAG: hypothetical protein JWO83_2666 [Caulobacteraceae bacterium]|nr:hypothetical protein [Caulobacteraceae bacterium]